ncbi:MAG: Inosine-5'-monophosphate dehydrogenase [Candidatus Heimdallarchaeota archaeon LC_2]|nr:MAG: Inosine-5'-monophosphate dehydrogenase [Candidatus Heimdallarchaeota archaeon LC_2]
MEHKPFFENTSTTDFRKLDLPLALTFDDVLLVPNHSPVSSRKNCNTTTLLTRKIPLSIPIISSNMDTVTETAMAISMAREGGIGIIHRFMTIEEQVKQVNSVKRSESILIENPYTLPKTAQLQDVWQLQKEKSISSILVVENNRKLVGILTARDLLFEEDPNTEISELMTKDLIIASPNIELSEAKELLHKNRIEKLPLVDTEGHLKGLITSKDLTKAKLWPNATKDEKGRLRVGAAIGVKNEFLERANQLFNAECDVIVVDVAHGHSDLVIHTIKSLRKEFGDDVQLIAGNVATADGTSELISQGVDAVKVGVGPGSICITRIVAGAGVPQLTAINDSFIVAKDEKIPLVGDGGIRTSGDIAKAIAVGASTVMLGNLLAGTTESPGVPVTRNGRRVKIIRGMASLGASLGRDKRTTGSVDDEFSNIIPEGVEAIVPFRGATKEILQQLVGGLQSGMSYVGATTIPDMWELAKFTRITQAGKLESKSHDVEKV